MQILESSDAMVAWADRARAEGLTIGFVPTMGYLHEGHRTLMRHVRPQVDRLVVSIYVNPLQFAPHEDFDVYPRDPEGDTAACLSEGVDVVFMPPELYPPGFETRISVPALDQRLCSVSRPHFFTGVATVVHRLLGLTRCHVAAFGEKDFQQLTILKRMVADLGMDVQIQGVPIVRESDGLAMSSRNAYLKGDNRQRAASLSRALRAMATSVAAGQSDPAVLTADAMALLDVDELDYLEIVDVETLVPVDRITRESRVAIAAVVGKTRLIDNMALLPPSPS